MSADQITPERIAELRERAATGGPDNAWRRSDYLAVLDALTTSRAEVASLRFQLQDKANGYALAKDGWVSEQDVSAELRAEVQRLTEEARQLRVMMQGQETECRHRERQDKVYRFQIASKDAEIQRLRDDLARRSDAGRVEVPELTYEAFAEIMDSTESLIGIRQREIVRRERITEWFRSRLSPSPQPATGTVVEVPDVAIPMGTALQRLGARLADLLDDEVFNDIEGNYLIPAIREMEASPQPSADVVVVRTDKASFDRAALKMMTAYKMLRRESPKKPHADIGWMEDLLSVGLDALRSSTNHDAQDAGEGR